MRKQSFAILFGSIAISTIVGYLAANLRYIRAAPDEVIVVRSSNSQNHSSIVRGGQFMLSQPKSIIHIPLHIIPSKIDSESADLDLRTIDGILVCMEIAAYVRVRNSDSSILSLSQSVDADDWFSSEAVWKLMQRALGNAIAMEVSSVTFTHLVANQAECMKSIESTYHDMDTDFVLEGLAVDYLYQADYRSRPALSRTVPHDAFFSVVRLDNSRKSGVAMCVSGGDFSIAFLSEEMLSIATPIEVIRYEDGAYFVQKKSHR